MSARRVGYRVRIAPAYPATEMVAGGGLTFWLDDLGPFMTKGGFSLHATATGLVLEAHFPVSEIVVDLDGEGPAS